GTGTYWITSTNSDHYWNIEHLGLEPKGRSCSSIDKYGRTQVQFCDSKNYFICEMTLPYSRYQPVVNVYVSNNVIRGDGTTTNVSDNFSSTKDIDSSSDGEYRIQLNTTFDVSDGDKSPSVISIQPTNSTPSIQ
ncbi:hypothetical protein JTB14_037365, partial [Gonioctena quinquepunctata]